MIVIIQYYDKKRRSFDPGVIIGVAKSHHTEQWNLITVLSNTVKRMNHLEVGQAYLWRVDMPGEKFKYVYKVIHLEDL